MYGFLLTFCHLLFPGNRIYLTGLVRSVWSSKKKKKRRRGRRKKQRKKRDTFSCVPFTVSPITAPRPPPRRILSSLLSRVVRLNSLCTASTITTCTVSMVTLAITQVSVKQGHYLLERCVLGGGTTSFRRSLWHRQLDHSPSLGTIANGNLWIQVYGDREQRLQATKKEKDEIFRYFYSQQLSHHILHCWLYRWKRNDGGSHSRGSVLLLLFFF